MTEDDIKQMSVVWRINRTDFQEDVCNGRNLFNIAGFINGNRELLNGSPKADMLLAKIYRALDEPQAAAECLRRLQREGQKNSEVRKLLEQSLVGYRSKRRARAASGCRIIFDCKGRINGKEVPETVCNYHIATLGMDCLIPDFEKKILGVKAGSATQFDVCFPDDYGNSELSGKKAIFQVYLYQVLEPVIYGSVEEMYANASPNKYRFDDLVGLKKHNENLHYMVLRDSVLHSYTGNITDSIALFNYYLKLGFKDEAMDIAYSLPDEPSITGHIGKILQVNNYSSEALDFLDKVADTSGEIENQRIKAYLQLQEYAKAEELASGPLLATNLETMNHRVQLASLLQLPVDEYLQRMDRMLDTQVKMMAAQVV